MYSHKEISPTTVLSNPVSWFESTTHSTLLKYTSNDSHLLCYYTTHLPLNIQALIMTRKRCVWCRIVSSFLCPRQYHRQLPVTAKWSLWRQLTVANHCARVRITLTCGRIYDPAALVAVGDAWRTVSKWGCYLQDESPAAWTPLICHNLTFCIHFSTHLMIWH